MLAKVARPTNDFRALARYLVKGKSGTPDPNRVAWIMSHNLPTDDPLLAATYMDATAQLSARTKNAAYHLIISWHEAERPDVVAMQTVAQQTLNLAGLFEHQALIMGHGDRPHPHLHVLLNRVHPETGRAWKTAHDFARFDRIMRHLSDEHGFAFAKRTPSVPNRPTATSSYQIRAPPTLQNAERKHPARNGAAKHHVRSALSYPINWTWPPPSKTSRISWTILDCV